MDEATFAIILPVVPTSARAADALTEAREQDSNAVVATDGTTFWVLSTDALHQAADTRGPDTAVGTLEGATIDVLSTARAAELGLDFSDLKAEWVESALRTLKTDAVITSIASTSAGRPVAFTIADPTGNFKRLVRPVYVCPVDQQEFPGPGTCSAHNRALVRKKR